MTKREFIRLYLLEGRGPGFPPIVWFAQAVVFGVVGIDLLFSKNPTVVAVGVVVIVVGVPFELFYWVRRLRWRMNDRL